MICSNICFLNEPLHHQTQPVAQCLVELGALSQQKLEDKHEIQPH